MKLPGIMSQAMAAAVVVLSTGSTGYGQQTQLNPGKGVWAPQNSPTSVSLRGLSIVNSQTAWASGEGGTILRTVNGGKRWRKVPIAEARELDFRDIHAFDEHTAVAMSAGKPARVYRTDNGGQDWSRVYEHPSDEAFFDALVFTDRRHGVAFSDPIDNALVLITSSDGGETWNELESHKCPTTLDGEAGFAASGSCMVADHGRIWIGLGGKHKKQAKSWARVLINAADLSEKWQYVETPLPASKSSGIFSLTFPNADHGVAVGGDYLRPNDTHGNVTVTSDGGRHWHPIKGNPPSGYRSAVAHYYSGSNTVLLATGPNGTDVSYNWGQDWQRVSEQGFHAIDVLNNGKAGWAVGSNGRIARLNTDILERGNLNSGNLKGDDLNSDDLNSDDLNSDNLPASID